MRILVLVAVFVLGLVGSGRSDEQAIERSADIQGAAADLLPPTPVTVAGMPLVVDGFAAPCVGDMDGDGLQDLLVGQYERGRLRVYRNVGSNAQPRFDSFEWFRAGGRIANVTTCCRTTFTPRFVDFDGDRDLDILTGSGHGRLYLFRRGADGAFAEAEVLIDTENQTVFPTAFHRGPPQRYPHNAAVFPFDWDNDGDWDLVIGTQYGISHNVGTLAAPIFEPTQPLVVDGKQHQHGLPPCIVDWDGDALPDLISGDYKHIVWHRNEGTLGHPVFGKRQELVNRENDNNPGRYRINAFDIVDFNGDGKVDLLVGDSFQEKNAANQPLTDEEKATYVAVRREHSALIYREFKGDEPRAEVIAHYRRLLSVAEQFYSLRRTEYRQQGHVWFYQRKP